MLIRELASADLPSLDAVCDACGRERWSAASVSPRSDRLVLVAVEAGQVVGTAKTHFHSTPDGAAPAGHYLGGLLVVPDFRRRSLGSALTRARMEWAWSRASSVFYFTNEHNAASIALHEALGFRPAGRFAAIHGVTADNGASELLLFEAARPGLAAAR
ncbi:GNAT family N-acetyltransferase [Pseudarthrobacter enclensis]|uniref:GNAT family N-acetyltransferase n=1 Tax=Pseudarthrobacter enclensis TaxID=993070 RepID=UPI0034419DA1